MMLNLLGISEVWSDENVICSADSKHNVLKLMPISDLLQVALIHTWNHMNKECVWNKINIFDDFFVYVVLQLTSEHATCCPNWSGTSMTSLFTETTEISGIRLKLLHFVGAYFWNCQ